MVKYFLLKEKYWFNSKNCNSPEKDFKISPYKFNPSTLRTGLGVVYSELGIFKKFTSNYISLDTFRNGIVIRHKAPRLGKLFTYFHISFVVVVVSLIRSVVRVFRFIYPCIPSYSPVQVLVVSTYSFT